MKTGFISGMTGLILFLVLVIGFIMVFPEKIVLFGNTFFFQILHEIKKVFIYFGTLMFFYGLIIAELIIGAKVIGLTIRNTVVRHFISFCFDLSEESFKRLVKVIKSPKAESKN